MKQIVFEKRQNADQPQQIIGDKTDQYTYHSGLVEITIGVTMLMIWFFVVFPLLISLSKTA